MRICACDMRARSGAIAASHPLEVPLVAHVHGVLDLLEVLGEHQAWACGWVLHACGHPGGEGFLMMLMTMM